MAKDNAIKLNLPSADDLFSTQEGRDDAQREKVMDIPLSEIDGFPDHPFKVRMDNAMLETAASVKKYGVLVPAIVRPNDGRYVQPRGKIICAGSGRSEIMWEIWSDSHTGSDSIEGRARSIARDASWNVLYQQATCLCSHKHRLSGEIP